MPKITHLLFRYDKKPIEETTTQREKKNNRVTIERKVNIDTGVPGTNDKVKGIIFSALRSEGQKYFSCYVVARFNNGQHRTIFRQQEMSIYK